MNNRMRVVGVANPPYPFRKNKLAEVTSTSQPSIQQSNYNFCLTSGLGFNRVGFATPEAYCKAWAYNVGSLRSPDMPITKAVVDTKPYASVSYGTIKPGKNASYIPNNVKLSRKAL